ncbi:MAG: nuclear transport factor 2 family protein, partial [bacterium]
MDRKAWLENIGRIIDSMDAEGFAALMTENGTFRFGNMPAVVGRANIAETVRNFW